MEKTQRYDLRTIDIENGPIMQYALDVLSALGKGQIILKAKGNSIPNAVAVANIITDKMLHGKSKVENIILDTEHAAGIGSMTSTVEIIINRI